LIFDVSIILFYFLETEKAMRGVGVGVADSACTYHRRTTIVGHGGDVGEAYPWHAKYLVHRRYLGITGAPIFCAPAVI
jgi:hypothetical protein